MLDADLKTQLQAYLTRLQQPIELVASLDDGETSRELEALLQEIASMSDKIGYRRADDDARRPSFAIARVGTDIEVRFAGIPAGTYAVSVLHDVNGDGKLGTNLLGIPNEPVGFSNNVRLRFGPPRFQAAAFAVDGDEAITVTVSKP